MFQIRHQSHLGAWSGNAGNYKANESRSRWNGTEFPISEFESSIGIL